MALIDCPDCGKRVSSQARASANCARALTSDPYGPVAAAGPNGFSATTIEATGKKWKGMQVVAVILIFLGMFACIGAALGADKSDNTMITVSVLGFFAGMGLFIAAGVGAWWNHG